MVLSIPTCLGTVVSEHRRDVEDSYRLRQVVHPVFYVGAANRRGAFGTQSQRFAAEIIERVHLLLDDVGLIPNAAAEKRGVFKDWRVDLLVSELARGLDRGGADRVPENLILRQDVCDAARCLEISLLSHFSTILCSPIAAVMDRRGVRRALLDFRIRSRGMAQSGSALDWGSRGHRFKSCCPDHLNDRDRGIFRGLFGCLATSNTT